MVSRTPRLLIKTRRVPKPQAFAVQSSSGKIPFKIEPLFPPASRKTATAMGMVAGEPEWHLASVPTDVDEVDLWELCHQLQSKGMGIAGGGNVAFAEPDLQQQWTYASPDDAIGKAFRAAAPDACLNPDPPDSHYPSPTPMDWRWYQGAGFSGLDGARTQVGNPADKVVIAHLDTGYRKGHAVLPQFLDF